MVSLLLLKPIYLPARCADATSSVQLYARKVTAEDGDISLVRKEEATTTLAGEEKVVVEVAAAAAATTAATAAVGCSSHEKRAHYRPTEAFREAAEESVKVTTHERQGSKVFPPGWLIAGSSRMYFLLVSLLLCTE